MTPVGRFHLFNLLAFSFAWIPVMYPFFTVGKGLSDREFFALNAVYYLTMCVFELPTGVLADRLGRRLALVLGSFGLGGAFATIYLAPSFAGTAAGMLLMGVAHTLLSGADAAWLYDVLLEEGRAHEYMQVEGRAHWTRMIGVSVCFVLGGAGAEAFGFAAPFALSVAVVFAAGCVALGFPEPRRSAVPLGSRGPLLASLRRTARDPSVRWIFLYVTVLFLLLRLAFHFYQIHMHTVGIHDYLAYGVVLGLLNFVAAPFAIAAHRFQARLGEARLATGLLLMMAVSFLLLHLFPTRWSIVFFALQQIPFGLMNPVTRTYTHRHVPSAERATVLSLQSLSGRLAVGVVSLFVGETLERTDARTVYLVVAAGAALAAVLLHATRPRGERAG